MVRRALYFTCHGCAPCVKMKPVFEQLRQEGYDIKEIEHEDFETRYKYGVTGVSITLILQFGFEVKRFTGIVDINTLRTALKMPDYIFW